MIVAFYIQPDPTQNGVLTGTNDYTEVPVRLENGSTIRIQVRAVEMLGSPDVALDDAYDGGRPGEGLLNTWEIEEP